MSEKNNEIMKYVGEQSLIRFKENADNAYSPMEHKHSYNDLEDRTHWEGVDTRSITWDGVIADHYYKKIDQGYFLVRITDEVISKEQIIGAKIKAQQFVSVDEQGENIYEELSLSIEESYVVDMPDSYGSGYLIRMGEGADACIVVVEKVVAENDDTDVFIDKPGTYFMCYPLNIDDFSMGSSTFIKELTFEASYIKPLDEKFIPDTISRADHVHSYNDLTDRTHYEGINTRSITWDGVIGDRDTAVTGNGGLLSVYVTDEILTKEQLLGSTFKMKTPIRPDEQGNIIYEEETYPPIGFFTDFSDKSHSSYYCTPYEYGECYVLVVTEIHEVDEFKKTGTYFFFQPLTEDNSVGAFVSELIIEENVVKQLDEKFIPDSVKVQPNWNQNDESAIDYIKNRPFYTGDLIMTEKYNDTLAFVDMGEDMSDMSGMYASEGTIDILSEELVAGSPIRIVYDNVVYDIVVQGHDMLGTYIGNGAIISRVFEVIGMPIELPDTGEPFVTFAGGFLTLSNEPSHDISISIYETEHIQLDRKYIKEIPGLKTKGFTYVINNEEVIAENGAEIFNDYEENIATGKCAHAEGSHTIASGYNSHAEGGSSKATGQYAHAEGGGSKAYGGNGSHAEGWTTLAYDIASHAEGYCTVAFGRSSHSEGNSTVALGEHAHAEGDWTSALGECSHAEGQGYISSRNQSDNQLTVSLTGEAYTTTYTVSEEVDAKYKDMIIGSSYPGKNNICVIDCTIVDNKITEIIFSEPVLSKAISNQQINLTIHHLIAKGVGSHAEGFCTMAYGEYQHVQGKYNMLDEESKYAHIVGNGTTDANRSNAHTLDWQGNAWFSGDVYVGSTSGTNRDEGSKKLITAEEVPQSDWNCNDETSAAFVKNRPFYSNLTITEILDVLKYDGEWIEEYGEVKWSPTNPDNMPVIDPVFVVGGTYTLIVNGVEYECVAQSGDGMVLLCDDASMTNYNVYAVFMPGETAGLDAYAGKLIAYAAVVKSNLAPVTEFRIVGMTGEIVKIDEIYLPDSVIDGINTAQITATDALNKANAAQTSADTNTSNLTKEISNREAADNLKMDKNNPVGTGSFSMNRKAGTVIGDYSHAEGYNTTASGDYSHAEGYGTTAYGDYSHAEGGSTTASGSNSHAEGGSTTASGHHSHAEGGSTTASGHYSHAEGYNTKVSGVYSHSEGANTETTGYYSHAQGDNTIANHAHMMALGRYNLCDDTKYILKKVNEGEYSNLLETHYYADSYTVDENLNFRLVNPTNGYTTLESVAYKYTVGSPVSTMYTQILYRVVPSSTSSTGYIIEHYKMVSSTEWGGKYIVAAGNGDEFARSNAHTLDWSGNAEFQGDVKANACGGEKPISLVELGQILSKDHIVLADKVNGFNYILEMHNGQLVSFCECESISVSDNVRFNDDGTLDFTDAIIATCKDGSTRVVTDFTSTYETVDSTTTYTITYVENGKTFTCQTTTVLG